MYLFSTAHKKMSQIFIHNAQMNTHGEVAWVTESGMQDDDCSYLLPFP